MNKEPFFIIGCVRSGTTLLRDVLRRHPNLASPEESHFYRWAEPFGTAMLTNPLTRNPDLKRHRELDGISQEEFESILGASVSKADLYKNYMDLYLLKTGQQGRRWFDKTPQNVNGAGLIANQFPGAQFVHIVRNPLDVVSSLRIGKVMKVDSLVGACNYWLESVQLIDVLKRAFPERVHEVRYEAFTESPLAGLEQLMAFLDESWHEDYFDLSGIRPKQHTHDALFTGEEVMLIEQLCGDWGRRYGYF